MKIAPNIVIDGSGESAETIESVVKQVSKVVSDMAGIQLGEKQANMVENRLKTRMLKLGIDQFSSYLKYLKMHEEEESQTLLSLMTTHYTFFFREFTHFEFLLNKGLNRLVEMARSRSDKTIHVWSAACSRGQEVYSLAMFFQFHLSQSAPDVSFKIWGTDVDPESVSYAKNAVYKLDELKQSPAMYVADHWVKGTGNVTGYIKAKNQLTRHCQFQPVNLLKCESFLKDKKFDLIFCRNVFIYFNQEQIKTVTQTFMNNLHHEGFLFLGVSETLNGLGLPYELIGSSVYQHKQVAKPVKTAAATPPTFAVKPALPRTLEILSVDDSPVILTLLGKILNSEGFKVTATAKNGREALDILKTKKFDAITLDLHMPELDGLGFLKERGANSTPVLIVSSVNREDTSIAQKAISMGAKDYVEKPSLENLSQAGNEIRSKLKTIVQFANEKQAPVESFKNSSPSSSIVNSQKNHLKSTTLSAVSTDSKKIKVLVVDDSATIRALLTKILSSDSQFEVVAQAEKPSQVEALIKQHKPDVITMDIHMPEMDGVQLLKKIHPLYKIPTVMISSMSKEDGPQVLQALEIGAVDYIQKPQAGEMFEASQVIRERLKIAAKAKVFSQTKPIKKLTGAQITSINEGLILMGASTGGTEALRIVLESMPAQIPPILIVQHIPPVFSSAFAQRLNSICPFEVKEAVNGDEVKPNQVLIAPGGHQMAVKRVGDKLIVQINNDAPVNRHKPSVDYMFRTVNELNIENIIAVILTGMGSDGARELKRLRDRGARTIAQDEATSVVFGMPREAISMGGAEFVSPLDQVAEKIVRLLNSYKSKKTDKAA